jgi:hypothetical protein
MNSSSSSTKIKIPNYTEDIISTRLKQIESHKTLVEFRGDYVTKTLFYLYLLKKYGKNNICYILNLEELSRVTVDRKYEWGLKLILRENPEKTQQFEQEYRHTCKILAARFVNCMTRSCEFILVPVQLSFRPTDDVVSGHENVIIYKRALNKIEHIEPHGEFFNAMNGLDHKRIQYLVKIFVDEVNTAIHDLNDDNITELEYEETGATCPNINNTHTRRGSLLGFQGLENQSVLQKFPDIEPLGYCLAWNMFMFEMGMLNPTMSNREISNVVIKYITTSQPPSKDIIFDYLLELVRGYANIVYQKIDKYFSRALGVPINKTSVTNNYTEIMEKIMDMMEMECRIEENKDYNVNSEVIKARDMIDKSNAVLKENPKNMIYQTHLRLKTKKLNLLNNHLELNREIKNSPNIRTLFAKELPPFRVEVSSKNSHGPNMKQLIYDIFGSSSGSSNGSSTRSNSSFSSVKELDKVTKKEMKKASPPEVIEISSSESSHSSHGSKTNKKQLYPHKNVIEISSSESSDSSRPKKSKSISKKHKKQLLPHRNVIEISSSESSHSSHGSKSNKSKKRKKQLHPHRNVIEISSGGTRYSVKSRRRRRSIS